MCQKKNSDEGGCGFFLWDDDAKLREESAVLTEMEREGNNSPLAPYSTKEDGGMRRRKPELISSYSMGAVEGNGGDADRTMNNDDERLMMEAQPRTPHKAQAPAAETATHFVTPDKRKFSEIGSNSDGLPTPKTGGSAFSTPSKAEPSAISRREEAAHSVFTTPSKMRPSRAAISGFDLALDAVSPTRTPTVQRYPHIGSAAYHGDTDNLYGDIMKELQARDVYIGEGAREAVEQICALYSRRKQGIMNSREISQLALKARDAKIEELNNKIATLEAELETERAVVRHLRWENGCDVGA